MAAEARIRFTGNQLTMEIEMSKTLQDHHNEGQSDRASGKDAEPPNGLLDNALATSREEHVEQAKENSAYYQGYRNAGK
jgi:hypothetical protein